MYFARGNEQSKLGGGTNYFLFHYDAEKINPILIAKAIIANTEISIISEISAYNKILKLSSILLIDCVLLCIIALIANFLF